MRNTTNTALSSNYSGRLYIQSLFHTNNHRKMQNVGNRKRNTPTRENIEIILNEIDCIFHTIAKKYLFQEEQKLVKGAPPAILWMLLKRYLMNIKNKKSLMNQVVTLIATHSSAIL